MDSSRREVGTAPEPGATTLVSRRCRVPDVSLRAFLAERAAPRVHWTTPAGLEMAGVGAATRLAADGGDRFDAVRSAADALFAGADIDAPDAGSAADDGAAAATRVDDDPGRPRLFGGFAFGDDHEPGAPWEGFPGAEFVLPELLLTRTDEGTWLTAVAAGEDADPGRVEGRLATARERVADLPEMRPTGRPPGVAGTERTTTREEWHSQVEAALERIGEGALTKVVLAVALSVDLERPVDVPDVLERLRASYPECFRFLVEPTDDAGFFGAPPERLVARRGDTVETEALAGSVARGDSPQEDEELADQLRDSDKMRREHQVVVDTICDQLAPISDAVTVNEQTVRKLATIQHLQTPIRARLADGGHVLDVVEALHPTPAVGGLPPGEASRTIRETETFDRGWYAAPVGWFDAAGDGEFAVGIRSAVASGDAATLFAGNGIVAESDPDEEWEEVGLKFRPVLDALE